MFGMDATFIALHVSSLLTVLLLVYVLRKKNKAQIHYAFIFNLALMFLWSLCVLLQQYMHMYFQFDGKVFMITSYIGVCFVPVSLLFTGLIFAHTRIGFTWKHALLFVPPVNTLILLVTNDFHKLFYLNYSFFDDQIVYGKYFPIHMLYSYACIVVGLYFLITFSIKNSGFFSKQSMLIIFGTIIPFSINILVTFNIISLNAYITPVSFSVAVMCFMFAIFKYQFLNLLPIALQRVVDLISDSFIVINEDLNIVDYNKTLIRMLGTLYNIRRNHGILEVFSSNPAVDFGIDEFMGKISESRDGSKSVSYEKHIAAADFDKYFMVEITPIKDKESFLGTIILLKDVTQNKKDLETIRENQAILMEQERLASLGQMIGGIAHNLKTPIMSISGGIEALKDLIGEYGESIGDKDVTEADHHEIAAEMAKWIEKMKPHCSYMSDIISTVKGQAVQFNTSTYITFTLDELVKRVELLMKHELKKFHCTLNIHSEVDMHTDLSGDVNSLVQIFDNLIMNAIHAYGGKNGDIDLKIKKDDNSIRFMLSDYGKGIQPDIKDRLFKEMVTTKGKDGTGLGLYMSYSNIKGRFGGNMWFESEQGMGTTFYITIPLHKNLR